MSALLAASEVTLEQARAAALVLLQRGTPAVGNISLQTLSQMAAGSPPYEPKRYSPAEVRMARAMLALGAELARKSEVPEGLVAVEGTLARTPDGRYLVLGDPEPEKEGAEECEHDCDVMGCSSFSHVVLRLVDASWYYDMRDQRERAKRGEP